MAAKLIKDLAESKNKTLKSVCYKLYLHIWLMTVIFILVGFVWLLIVYVHICPSTLIFLLISITVTKIKCLRWHKKLFDCYINAEPLEEEKEEEEEEEEKEEEEERSF